MYESIAKRTPLYSMPHLSLTSTGWPVRSVRNGLGFTMLCGNNKRSAKENN